MSLQCTEDGRSSVRLHAKRVMPDLKKPGSPTLFDGDVVMPPAFLAEHGTPMASRAKIGE